MSRKNILSVKDVAPNKVHVTFDTVSGNKTYEYIGNSARAFKRGSDPGQLSGRLIEPKKTGK